MVNISKLHSKSSEMKEAADQLYALFPEYIEQRFKHLNMMTTIQVFKGVVLTHNQCSLKLYERVKLDSNLANLPEKLSFEYELSDKPCFKWLVN